MLGLSGLGLLTVGFPFFAVDHLGVERGAAGYLWGAFALGSMLGALLLVRLQARWPPERIVVGAIATFGLPDAAVADPDEPAADARGRGAGRAWRTGRAWPPPSPRASATCPRT